MKLSILSKVLDPKLEATVNERNAENNAHGKWHFFKSTNIIYTFFFLKDDINNNDNQLPGQEEEKQIFCNRLWYWIKRLYMEDYDNNVETYHSNFAKSIFQLSI